MINIHQFCFNGCFLGKPIFTWKKPGQTHTHIQFSLLTFKFSFLKLLQSGLDSTKKIFVDNHRPENILVTTPTASKHRKELQAVACTREYQSVTLSWHNPPTEERDPAPLCQLYVITIKNKKRKPFIMTTCARCNIIKMWFKMQS